MSKHRFRQAAATLALALALAAGGAASAFVQDNAEALRASGQAGEQADGYLGIVGSPPASVRAQVDGINIRRRARYTEIAARRGARVEEVAATAACEIFAARVAPGQYYRLTDGVWRQRSALGPVPRPEYCL